jgi:hypothetical protein
MTLNLNLPLRHHWKNFFAKGNKGLTQWEMLHGRDTLRLEDQKKIQGLIESTYKCTGAFKRSYAEGPTGTERQVLTPEAKDREREKQSGLTIITSNIPTEHNGGTKRKAEATDDEPAAKKQKTEETPEEKEKREHNEMQWKFKDALKGLKPKDLKEICEENGQSSKGGTERSL